MAKCLEVLVSGLIKVGLAAVLATSPIAGCSRTSAIKQGYEKCKIVFEGGPVPGLTLENPKYGVCVINPDGSDGKRLTCDYAKTPTFSPDGRKIVFVSDRDRNIYLMNGDGTDEKRLTKGPTETPTFSPDGRKIAFASNKDYNYDIYVMNDDGTDEKRLTVNNELSIITEDDRFPSFSPDGKKVVYTSYVNKIKYPKGICELDEIGKFTQIETHGEISVINSDGTDEKRLTNYTSETPSSETPTFSPDGRKILYVSNKHDNYDIYVMNDDGTDKKRMTDNPEDDMSPSWSPDGEKIVFVSKINGYNQICVMNSDGSEKEILTSNKRFMLFEKEYDYKSPSWSPDGEKIAFTSKTSCLIDRNISIINADGSDQKNLTRFSFFNYEYLKWSPPVFEKE